MITKLEKKLRVSYGFEIEGLLDMDSFNKFMRMDLTSNGKLKFEYADDGSVSFDDYEYDNFGVKEVANWREFRMGIFKNKKDLLKALALFENDVNYCRNDTCGLHLHIRIGNRLYKSAFNDWEFIKKLHKFFMSKKLCDCQRHRIGNSFCMGYSDDLSRFIRDWKYKEKYRIVRNHPQGTFEFRIFSACEHKVKNVKLFFDFFFGEITKIPFQKSEVIKVNNDYVRDTISL